MSENKGGRPTLFTPELVGILERAFQDGANITQACLIAKIHKDTYFTWIKNNQEFSDQMAEAQEYPTTIAKKVLVDRIKLKDAETSKWWVERREKQNFSLRNELSGPDGAPLSLEVKDSTE